MRQMKMKKRSRLTRRKRPVKKKWRNKRRVVATITMRYQSA